MRELKEYQSKLKQACEWAKSDTRKAWKRALEIATQSNGLYNLEEIRKAKEEVFGSVTEYLTNDWFPSRYEAAKSNNSLFDLDLSPEELWVEFAQNSSGVFDETFLEEIITEFLIGISATRASRNQLFLGYTPEGWGLSKEDIFRYKIDTVS